jgi:4-alpha-glucanotransferase
MTGSLEDLHRLAEWQGVQLAYRDVFGNDRAASPDSLLAILQALGTPIQRVQEAGDVLRQQRLDKARRMLEPVFVCWRGDPAIVNLRVPRVNSHTTLDCSVTDEDGRSQHWTLTVGAPGDEALREVEGYEYVDVRLSLPDAMPEGYHELAVQWQGQQESSLVISAPRSAFCTSAGGQRIWGVFLPVYALHSEGSTGGGDFGDLELLNRWIAQLGGNLVATLPLLASFFREPGDESPYRPVSRLFWNEFFLDLPRIPEAQSASVQRILRSSEFQTECASLRDLPTVDYQRQMALKRRVLEALAESYFHSAGQDRRSAFEHFQRENPGAADYAEFRAADERRGEPWSKWPQPMRDGQIHNGDYDESVKQYHMYVQWALQEQLSSMADAAREAQLTWYLDLPIGVHPDGYDAWRHRDAYALAADGGAPPDRFFTDGQRWCFPPLHPQRLREQRYSYFLSVIRNHLRYAKLLRLDHVMSLHRLYWVPSGAEATDGVYVRYPAEEFYALLTLESQRHQARLIGENLGTVPPEVDEAMDRHNVGRLYVLQYESQPDGDTILEDRQPEYARHATVRRVLGSGRCCGPCRLGSVNSGGSSPGSRHASPNSRATDGITRA